MDALLMFCMVRITKVGVECQVRCVVYVFGDAKSDDVPLYHVLSNLFNLSICKKSPAQICRGLRLNALLGRQ